jgi:tetratricopeptide (TPR) repeat protein
LQSQTPAPKGLDHELGVAYYKTGDYPNAVRTLQAAQKEEPNDGEVIQLTGLSLYLAGKPADAIPNLEKVQTWYPRANIDAAYVQTKKYSEGGAAFAKMFACRRIRPPRICSPLACCFVSISDRSRRNTD